MVRTLLALLAVVCLVLGSVAAFFFGDQLRPATRVRRPGADELRWDYGPLVSSAGVNASWAVLYGAGYFVIAIAVVAVAALCAGCATDQEATPSPVIVTVTNRLVPSAVVAVKLSV